MTEKINKDALLNDINFIYGAVTAAEEVIILVNDKVRYLDCVFPDVMKLMPDVVFNLDAVENDLCGACYSLSELIKKIEKSEEL